MENKKIYLQLSYNSKEKVDDEVDKKLEGLSGLIKTRLDELRSEIKEKYNFLKINRSGELCMHDENSCFRKSDDIIVKESIAIINRDTLIGKIDYVNVVLDDQCSMSKNEFYQKYEDYFYG